VEEDFCPCTGEPLDACECAECAEWEIEDADFRYFNELGP
jgi:hypothetical protein